jgi:hypothetical protein
MEDTDSRREYRASGKNVSKRPAPASGKKCQGPTKNGRDRSTTHPPSIIFRDRIYVMADGQGRAKQTARTTPGSRGAASKARPYIKGTFRVYSSRFPHLAPVSARRKRRRDAGTQSTTTR